MKELPFEQSTSHTMPQMRGIHEKFVFWSLMAVCLIGGSLRDFPAVVSLVLLGLTVFPVIAGSLYVRDPAVWALSALVLLYGVLSWMHVFPTSWTAMYEPGAIGRQMYWGLMFPLLLSAYGSWWADFMTVPKLSRLRLLFFGSTAGWLVLHHGMLAANVIVRTEPESLFRGANNQVIVWILLLTIYAFSCSRPRALAVLGATFVASLFFNTNVQNPLFLLVVMLWRFMYPTNTGMQRFLFWLFVTVLVGAYIFGWFNIVETWTIDANTAIRILFVENVIAAVIDTNFLGVGFGTEAIQNYYSSLPVDQFADPDSGAVNFIMIGTHNTFAEVLFRLGLVGFAFLMTFVWQRSAPCSRKRHARSALQFAVLTPLFMTLYVNNTFVTPTEIVGAAFCFGFIMALQEGGDDRWPNVKS